MVALNYYLNADLYLFDEFQTASKGKGVAPRRPRCETLADVFTNIRDDENEHVKTMVACQVGFVRCAVAAGDGTRVACRAQGGALARAGWPFMHPASCILG